MEGIAKMGKIEKGCMAILVNCKVPSNIGKIVTVGKYIGTKSINKPGWGDFKNIWGVDQKIKFTCGGSFFFATEHSMERIDYDDIEEKNHTYELVETEE